MRIIGITGGIGSGKSVVLNLLKEKHDSYIVETDRLAHRLMEPGTEVYNQIISSFGDLILQEDGTINRKKLGAIVFGQEERLDELNKIVHPAVKKYILNDINQKRNLNTIPYYIIESAILIEAGYKEICDEIWYVYVDLEERLKRLIAGRGENREHWQNIILNQSNEAFYRDNCDWVIDNSYTIEKTANMVNELLSLPR